MVPLGKLQPKPRDLHRVLPELIGFAVYRLGKGRCFLAKAREHLDCHIVVLSDDGIDVVSYGKVAYKLH